MIQAPFSCLSVWSICESGCWVTPHDWAHFGQMGVVKSIYWSLWPWSLISPTYWWGITRLILATWNKSYHKAFYHVRPYLQHIPPSVQTGTTTYISPKYSLHFTLATQEHRNCSRIRRIMIEKAPTRPLYGRSLATLFNLSSLET